jgi:hypothetical protein
VGDGDNQEATARAAIKPLRRMDHDPDEITRSRNIVRGREIVGALNLACHRHICTDIKTIFCPGRNQLVPDGEILGVLKRQGRANYEFGARRITNDAIVPLTREQYKRPEPMSRMIFLELMFS